MIFHLTDHLPASLVCSCVALTKLGLNLYGGCSIFSRVSSPDSIIEEVRGTRQASHCILSRSLLS